MENEGMLEVLTNIAATIMDSSASLRKLLFDKVISDSPPIPELLASPEMLENYVKDNVQSAWHASPSKPRMNARPS